MRTDEFDFSLPPELIASRPLEKRDSSRLLVLRKNGRMDHRFFSDLPSYLNAGDMIIVNNTKVFPARLSGVKPDGSRLDVLLISEISPGSWNIMTIGKYTGPLKISETLSLNVEQGKRAHFDRISGLADLFWREGQMPLPPYIRRAPDETDKERYQTVYALRDGSIAAPTAGLHFTETLFDALRSHAVLVRSITLHVGTGTFRPIRTEHIEDHVMDRESFEISRSLLSEIQEVKDRGNRVIAVGTTTTRAIEGFLAGRCRIKETDGVIRGWTDVFIYEGFPLRAVDSLITNFHLPHSTPLLLASRFAGRVNLLSSYRTAISMGYRFFSYGDAMLVL